MAGTDDDISIEGHYSVQLVDGIFQKTKKPVKDAQADMKPWNAELRGYTIIGVLH